MSDKHTAEKVRRYQRTYRKESKSKYKAEGRCPKCKRVLAPDKFIGVSGNPTIYCRECMDKVNAYFRELRRKQDPDDWSAETNLSSAKFNPKYQRVQQKTYYSPSDLMRLSPEKLARVTTKILRGKVRVTKAKGQPI